MDNRVTLLRSSEGNCCPFAGFQHPPSPSFPIRAILFIILAQFPGFPPPSLIFVRNLQSLRRIFVSKGSTHVNLYHQNYSHKYDAPFNNVVLLLRPRSIVGSWSGFFFSKDPLRHRATLILLANVHAYTFPHFHIFRFPLEIIKTTHREKAKNLVPFHRKAIKTAQIYANFNNLYFEQLPSDPGPPPLYHSLHIISC